MENIVNACPWTNWEPSTLNWCEQRLCEWIREPSNAWSNLAFVIVGIWVIYRGRSETNRHLRLLGIFSILIGLMSFFYHATGSFIGEVLDFSSMFFMSTYFVCVNGARHWHWDYKRLRLVAFVTVTTSIALLVWLKTVGTTVFALQFVTALWIEYKIYKSGPHAVDYRGLLFSLGAFVLAYILWWLDKAEVLCDPKNHLLTGHAAWHILTAVSIGGMYFFYRQFALVKDHKLPGTTHG
jgi:hypothetical protein